MIKGRPLLRRKISEHTIWTPSLKFNVETGEAVSDSLPRNKKYDGSIGVTIGGRNLKHFGRDSVWANDTDTIYSRNHLLCAVGWGDTYVEHNYSKSGLTIRRWPQVEIETLQGSVAGISPDSTKLFIQVSSENGDSPTVDSGWILSMPSGTIEKIPLDLSTCNINWAHAFFRSNSEDFIVKGTREQGGSQLWHCSTNDLKGCHEIRLSATEHYFNTVTTSDSSKVWFQAHKNDDGHTSELISYEWKSCYG